MDILSSTALPTASYGIAFMLLGSLCLVVACIVMARNFAASRRDPVMLDLVPDEDEVDRIELGGWLSWDRLVLTDRRVIFQRASWLLSTRSQHVLALDDVYSVTWRVGINGLLFLLGIVLLPGLRPAGLVLVMLGLESAACATWFVVKHARMPFLTHGVRVRGRRAVADLARFHQRVHWAWARLQRVPDGTPRVSTVPPLPVPTVQAPGFEWGPIVWATVAATLVLATTQRLVSSHVSYDDLLFAPLYLALPVAAARWSMRDGVWSAALGFAATWSVKFPGVFDETGYAHPIEAVAILVTLVAMAVASAWLARRVAPVLAPAGLLLWPLGALVAGGSSTLEPRVVAVTLLAMGASTVFAWTGAHATEASHAPA